MDTVAIVSKDGVIGTVEKYIIPGDSTLHGIVNRTGGFSYRVDSEDRPILEYSADEVDNLFEYLRNGNVPHDDSELNRLIDILDYYGIYRLKAEYPSDFIRIKMKSDHYRRTLYDPKFKHNPEDTGLFALTEELYMSFELARNVIYMFGLCINEVIEDDDRLHDRYHDCEYEPNYAFRVDLKPMLSKSKTVRHKRIYSSPRTLEYKNTFHMNYDIHKRCLLFINNSDEAYRAKFRLEEKTKNVDNLFAERDAIYDNHILRENSFYITSRSTVSRVQSDTPFDYTLKWGDALSGLAQLRHKVSDVIKNWDNVVVAGGAVARAILGADGGDIDIFIYGVDTNRANAILRELMENARKDTYFLRTQNSISWGHSEGMQVILRLYKTKREIIESFDLQSSQLLFDGTQVLMTESCRYAFDNMINVVDFDRMSPTYEYRLWKYQQLGFGVYIPGFDESKINIGEIRRIHDVSHPHKGPERMKLEGLSRLLYGYHFGLKAAPSDYEQPKRVVRDVNFATSDGNCYIYLQLSPGLEKRYTVSRYQTNNIDYIFKLDMSAFADKKISSGSKKYSKRSDDYIDNDSDSDENILDNLEMPPDLSWKVIKPGEQASSTFHKIVYGDIDKWYNGPLYNKEGIHEKPTVTVPTLKNINNYFALMGLPDI
jgi:hypothetical protein